MPENGTPEGGRDDALERELGELGRDLDYPPTPDLASSVRRRLESEGTARRRTPPLWAVAAALLAVFLVVPAISVAVFEPFGGDTSLSGSSGGSAGGGASDGEASPESARQDAMMSEASTEAAPSSAAPDSDLPPSAAGDSSPLGRELGLGEQISLATAEARMGGLLLPEGAGRPDEVYAARGPTGDGVVLVYGTRQDFDRGKGTTGLVLTELPGGIEAAFGSGTGSGAETVEVDGERGVWVSGPGTSGAESYRLTEGLGGSALFFARGGVALRLESNLPRGRAIQLAETVD